MAQFFEIVARVPLVGDARKDAKTIAGIEDTAAALTEVVEAGGGTVASRIARTLDKPSKAPPVARVKEAAE